MNKIFCDRCGLEISKNDAGSAVAQYFPDAAMFSFIGDLCSKCRDLSDELAAKLTDRFLRIEEKDGRKIKDRA